MGGGSSSLHYEKILIASRGIKDVSGRVMGGGGLSHPGKDGTVSRGDPIRARFLIRARFPTAELSEVQFVQRFFFCLRLAKRVQSEGTGGEKVSASQHAGVSPHDIKLASALT